MEQARISNRYEGVKMLPDDVGDGSGKVRQLINQGRRRPQTGPVDIDEDERHWSS